MAFTSRNVLTPQERRERNREEMSSAILEAAREIMHEEGAGGLNLNKLAKRVNMTTPALYTYFPGKFAIYDGLYRQGIHTLGERETSIWHNIPLGWERLRAWFRDRLDFAIEHRDLYHLMFSNPVPGFVPSEESAAAARRQLALTTRGLEEIFEAGVVQPNIPIDRAVDLLLSMRHGIVAEVVGKANVVSDDSGRFEHLVDDAITMLKLAWAPDSADSGGEGDAPG
jgi:AcrR family transcriptional regulator